MITILYYYSLVALCIATSILGLLFLTQFNENREAMRNYRIAKRLLAIAFFIVAIGNLVELFGHTNKPIDTANQGFFLSQIITLSISVTQAFIFTLVCVMLLDPKNIQSKQLKRQIIAIVLYVAVAVVSYILLPISAAKISIFLLSIIYCIVLIYFTVFFIHRYRSFRRAMDNFYSDDIATRMRWIAVVFYAALVIGIFSLVIIQHSNFEMSVVFNFTLLCFYTFFGVKLLNYPWQFEIIETPMAEEISDEIPNTKIEAINNKKTPHINVNTSIELWIAKKHFLKSGITIDDLAKFLGTNRTYLSSYLNSEKNTTFRQWINLLRIEEAKRIISDNPKITMTELATRLGYADTSTFFRQFKAKEGVQPSVWEQEYLSV